MLRWFLFETWLGDRLLACLERWVGLGVVEVCELEPVAPRVIGGEVAR